MYVGMYADEGLLGFIHINDTVKGKTFGANYKTNFNKALFYIKNCLS